ncbi:hypothetical protein HYX01_05060 [Candidatus Woesearchaeota archaeon]|nr:hypothetical protein [Candidatus Woesearchaeota archaeon]
MELKVISTKKEPMLSRTKVEAEIKFEKAIPPRDEIKNSMAKALNIDEKLLVVKGIYNLYGLKKARNITYAYENEESLKRIETEKKKKDGKGKKERKKADADKQPV